MNIHGLDGKDGKQILEFEDDKLLAILEIDVSEAMTLRDILNKFLLNFMVVKRKEYTKKGCVKEAVDTMSTAATPSASIADNKKDA